MNKQLVQGRYLPIVYGLRNHIECSKVSPDLVARRAGIPGDRFNRIYHGHTNPNYKERERLSNEVRRMFMHIATGEPYQ